MGVIISNCFARMSRYLSGEELMHQCKRSNELPGRGGFKDHEPDGSWLQRMKLENFHAERNEVLSEERVEKLGALSVGDWDPDKKKIVVTRNRGKFWKNMGHCVDGEKLLHPEEALFLVDQGSMEVMYKGQPMSLQELYHKLLPSARSCDDYVLCGHLMRLGFIVRRADTFEEKSSRNNEDKKRVRDDDDDDDDDDGVQNSAAKKFKSSADVSGHSSKSQKQEIAKSQTKHDLHAQTSRFNNLNCTNIFSLNSDKVCVDPRSLSLALPDLELSEPLEFDVSDERRKMLIIGKDLFENHERRKNFTGVENWTQLKKLSRKERLLLTPARVLWEDDDDLRPLHDPDVVCTPSETLKRLRQRNKKVTIEDVSNIVGDFPSQDLNTVMFNVFPPDSKFKKSKPGRPLACTLSVNAQSPPPLGVEALKLIGEAQRRGGSSLMFGAVESGEVSFFSYNLVDLPTLV